MLRKCFTKSNLLYFIVDLFFHRLFQIRVLLSTSQDYTIVNNNSREICVCGGKGKTVKFSIKPTKLGKIAIAIQAFVSQFCGPSKVL